MQEPTKRFQGVIEPIRRSPQSPNTAIIPGIPLAWSTYKDIRLEKDILDTKDIRRDLTAKDIRLE